MGIMERWGLPDWAGWTALVVLIILVEATVAIYFVRQRHIRGTREANEREAIRQTGTPAIARILETTDTGTRLGADRFFVWKLRLAVQPPAQGRTAGVAFAVQSPAGTQSAGTLPAPFETEIRVPVSPARFADFAEGRDIRVRVDERTRNVVVDQRTE